MARRVVIASVAPLFPDVVYGGSQAILTAVASGLAESGCDVDLVCSARPENRGGFEIAPGVRVRPLLHLTGAFPDPYEVPPASLARTANDLRPLLASADIVYLHADIFHFRGLIPGGVPIVRSFHDFHYETALISAFAYSADLTIVPSRYLANCISATVGAAGVRALEPLRVIPNGIDTAAFTPSGPAGVAGLPVKSPDDLVLLYPHRPDERKGVCEALEVTTRLARAAPARNVRLVVPRHLDAGRLPFMAEQYRLAESRAAQLGIADRLEFVEWVPRERMPGFLRYGDATLCLGSFIEAFGLTPYESIACGTPVVAANVGAYRELPPLAGIRCIEYGDHEGAAAAVLSLADEPVDSALPEDFQSARMVRTCVDAIVNARTGAQPHGTAASAAPGLLTLAPWCHSNGARIYDDYAYGFRDLPGLAAALSERPPPDTFTAADLAAAGVPGAEIDAAIELSVIVPQFRRH